MAKPEFLDHVKTAARFLSPRVETDNASLDGRSLEQRLVRAAVWLSPSAVKGFDVRDFSELPTEERARLRESVERFRQAAEQVPPDQPATDAQLQAGLSAFLELLRVLRPYLGADRELRRLGDALQSVAFPEYVVGLNYRIGADSSGGTPAVWVWVIVEDKVVADKSFAQKTAHVRELIEKALRQAEIQRWPYVYFRSVSEQRGL